MIGVLLYIRRKNSSKVDPEFMSRAASKSVRTETFSAADGEFVTDVPPLNNPRIQSRTPSASSHFDPMSGGADVFMTQNPMYYSSANHGAGRAELANYSELLVLLLIIILNSIALCRQLVEKPHGQLESYSHLQHQTIA